MCKNSGPYLAMGQGGQLPPPEKLASEYNEILFVFIAASY